MVSYVLEREFMREVTYTLPNFFLVGAARAGTTAVYEELSKYEQVFLCQIKEPNFFCFDLKDGTNIDLWERKADVKVTSYLKSKDRKIYGYSHTSDVRDYLELFSSSDGMKVVGECSTTYLLSQVAASEILNFNPEAKILIVLRNPVARAASHFSLLKRLGEVPVKQSFEEYIHSYYESKDKYNFEKLLEYGLYYDQVKRYLSLFPRESILITLYDDLKSNPEKFFRDISEFLSVDFPGYDIDTTYSNASALPRFPVLTRFLYESGLKKYIRAILPSRIAADIKKHFFKPQGQQVLSADDKEYLLEYYESDIKKTQGLIGIDLSSWCSL